MDFLIDNIGNITILATTAVAGALAVARVWVGMTKRTDDDVWLAKVTAMLKSIGLVKK